MKLKIGSFSRREFLKVSAILTGSLGLGAEPPPVPQLSFILVGDGAFGRVLREEITRCGASCLGIVGSSVNKSRAAGNDLPPFDDLDEALEKTGSQAVVIASPDNTHVPLAQAALAKRAHVLLSAPVASSLQEIHDLCASAKAARRHLSITSAARLLPQRVALSKLIAQGGIGHLERVSIYVSAHLAQGSWQRNGSITAGLLGRHGQSILGHVLDSLGNPSDLSSVWSSGTTHGYIGESVPIRQVVEWKLGSICIRWEGEVHTAQRPPIAEVIYQGTAGSVFLDWFGGWAASPHDGGRTVHAPAAVENQDASVARHAWLDLCESAARRTDPKSGPASLAHPVQFCALAMDAFNAERILLYPFETISSYNTFTVQRA